ncbi:MAG: AEC family transporter [Oscillospiraceae bacterium]|jgi:predicted permease|nr:AEC family transporter [Oscillospiraceae bacterium]
MQNFINMVNIQAVLFIYLAIGVFARKMKIIGSEALQSFINYIINIALPCMIFNSFALDMSRERLLSALFVLAVSFAICLLSWILGKLLYRRVPDDQRGIMQYGTLISNAGFAGLPLVEGAFGPEALFYASVFLIPSRIFMWSTGISLFTTASLRTKIKSVLLNPGIIAVVLGLFQMILQVPLHPILSKALLNIGNSTSSLSIIVVGAILAEVPIRTVLEKNVLILSFVRLILIPGIVLIVLKAMGTPLLITASCVLLTGMPCGSTTALLAQKYGANYQFASKCVFVSTVLSLITAPLLALFL